MLDLDNLSITALEHYLKQIDADENKFNDSIVFLDSIITSKSREKEKFYNIEKIINSFACLKEIQQTKDTAIKGIVKLNLMNTEKYREKMRTMHKEKIQILVSMIQAYYWFSFEYFKDFTLLQSAKSNECFPYLIMAKKFIAAGIDCHKKCPGCYYDRTPVGLIALEDLKNLQNKIETAIKNFGLDEKNLMANVNFLFLSETSSANNSDNTINNGRKTIKRTLSSESFFNQKPRPKLMDNCQEFHSFYSVKGKKS